MSAGIAASIRSGTSRERMPDLEPPRVKRLAREAAQLTAKLRVSDVTPQRASVLRIARDRPAGCGKVDADLMHAAGHKTARQESQADRRGAVRVRAARIG